MFGRKGAGNDICSMMMIYWSAFEAHDPKMGQVLNGSNPQLDYLSCGNCEHFIAFRKTQSILR